MSERKLEIGRLGFRRIVEIFFLCFKDWDVFIFIIAVMQKPFWNEVSHT